jgi:hypothetical protein
MKNQSKNTVLCERSTASFDRERLPFLPVNSMQVPPWQAAKYYVYYALSEANEGERESGLPDRRQC